MGEEVDKIYVQLKGYESEIKQSNKKLDTMFKTNVDYYHELVKYILAGEQACKEIEAYIAQRQQDMENTGDQSIQFELTSLNQALMMLEQRTQDLRTAEKCGNAVHSHDKDYGVQQLQSGEKNQFCVYRYASCI